MRRVWLITQRPLKVLLALVLGLVLVLDVCREFYTPWFENETEDENEDENRGKTGLGKIRSQIETAKVLLPPVRGPI